VRIAVCAPQVPFVRGGAEIFADTLVTELRGRGHETELVTVPFKWYPGTRVLTQAFLWRLLDLEESDGRPIDLVVGTKFPSYAVRHPNKRVWVLHQFRQAYELDRTELGQFGESAPDRALRRKVQELDRVALGEARRVFATSRNVADRLARATGLEAEVMPHPPQELPYRCESYGDFVLSVNRLDRAKRIDLLLEAAALDPSLNVVIAGDGPDREEAEAEAERLGVARQVFFLGKLDSVADLLRAADLFLLPSSSESFGLAALEAMACGTPVLCSNTSSLPEVAGEAALQVDPLRVDGIDLLDVAARRLGWHDDPGRGRERPLEPPQPPRDGVRRGGRQEPETQVVHRDDHARSPRRRRHEVRTEGYVEADQPLQAW